MIEAEQENKLSTLLEVIRDLRATVQARVLYLKFDEIEGLIAKDRSDYDYDAKYIGSRTEAELWTGDSVVIDGDYFELPAAPLNNLKDFTIMGWVKTDSLDFTLLSCKRASQMALEITNKKVIIDGQEFSYAGT